MKIFRYMLMIVFAVSVFEACKEEGRFAISSDDKTVPGKPVVKDVKPLNGGARVFFTAPDDEKVLQVIAEYVAANGKTFKFSASYYKDSIDVYGMGDTIEYTFHLYSESRSGMKSDRVPVKVKPLIPNILAVKDFITVRPGFNAFLIDWKNPLEFPVNVCVDIDFSRTSMPQKNVRFVFSSKDSVSRQFIREVNIGPDEPFNMKIHVEDTYGNSTGIIDIKDFTLYKDAVLPKDTWVLPLAQDSIDWVGMVFGNAANGRIERVMNGLIDQFGDMNDYMHAGGYGEDGVRGSNRNKWNLIIDLGDYYELSRVITHQRHSGSQSNPIGRYYDNGDGENVGHYSLWYLDETVSDGKTWMIFGEPVKGTWVNTSEIYIPIPWGLASFEYPDWGLRGDEGYMYPDDPKFTPPARWFRYQSLSAFADNYKKANNNCLSEITLYGNFYCSKDDKNRYNEFFNR